MCSGRVVDNPEITPVLPFLGYFSIGGHPLGTQNSTTRMQKRRLVRQSTFSLRSADLPNPRIDRLGVSLFRMKPLNTSSITLWTKYDAAALNAIVAITADSQRR
jgi:hypothetical protein